MKIAAFGLIIILVCVPYTSSQDSTCYSACDRTFNADFNSATSNDAACNAVNTYIGCSKRACGVTEIPQSQLNLVEGALRLTGFKCNINSGTTIKSCLAVILAIALAVLHFTN